MSCYLNIPYYLFLCLLLRASDSSLHLLSVPSPLLVLNMIGSHNPLLKDMEDNSHANPHGAVDHSGAGGGDHGHGGEFNFGEIFIHQVMISQSGTLISVIKISSIIISTFHSCVLLFENAIYSIITRIRIGCFIWFVRLSKPSSSYLAWCQTPPLTSVCGLFL